MGLLIESKLDISSEPNHRAVATTDMDFDLIYNEICRRPGDRDRSPITIYVRSNTYIGGNSLVIKITRCGSEISFAILLGSQIMYDRANESVTYPASYDTNELYTSRIRIVDCIWSMMKAVHTDDGYRPGYI